MYYLGLSNDKGRKFPATARIFVFVCFGNIMRSPMCEALMKQATAAQASQITVMSAGLHASPATPAHPWALAAARELGISLDDHRARQLTAEMVSQADAIFAMDYRNRAELLAQYRQAKEKIFMLRTYEGAADRGLEILDPYHGDVDGTRLCYRLLQKCVHNVASDVLQSLSSVQGGLLQDGTHSSDDV
jgi:protein-tyrosine-phosphatase